MDEINLPDHVKVISLSLDKNKDFEKWLNMTEIFNQKISYHLNGTKRENQEFLKLIELESIPRYILIDKDLNLLDEAFYHPQDPEFLKNLNEIKSNKKMSISIY